MEKAFRNTQKFVRYLIYQGISHEDVTGLLRELNGAYIDFLYKEGFKKRNLFKDGSGGYFKELYINGKKLKNEETSFIVIHENDKVEILSHETFFKNYSKV